MYVPVPRAPLNASGSWLTEMSMATDGATYSDIVCESSASVGTAGVGSLVDGGMAAGGGSLAGGMAAAAGKVAAMFLGCVVTAV